jgi:uncharacterized integral membrane protein
VYRIGFVIVASLAILFGLLVGSLNSDIVTIDLLWLQLQWPLGLTLLSFMALGLIIGLVLSFLVSVLPLRLKLGKLGRSEPTPME